MKIVLNILVVIVILFARQTGVQAQIVLTPYQPGYQTFRVSDAFDFSCMNMGQDQIKGLLTVEIRSAGGEEVMYIESQVIEIFPGTVMQGSYIQWLDYKFGTGALGTQLNMSGYLSSGQYTYCVRFVNLSNNVVEASSCLELEIRPIVPMLLLTPSDGSNPCDPLIFTWQPPISVDLKELLFAFKLVRVEDSQSPVEAILQNVPIVDVFDIKEPFYAIDFSLVKLEPQLQYAWQVEVFEGATSLQKSEVWSFIFCDDKPPVVKIDKQYQFLNLEEGRANFATVIEEVNFAIDNRFNLPHLPVTIYCQDLDQFGELKVDPIPLHEGLNFVDLKLDITRLPANQRLVLVAEMDEYGTKGYYQFLIKK
jgi:hypothetical protein